MNKSADFLIAGGGPAGATAAALLATRGNRVCLLERAAAPHHKVCGEFVSFEALAYLRAMGVDPWQVGAVPIRRLRLAADELISETALPFQAASLSRLDLDAALLHHAQECGAHLIAGKQVEQLSRIGDGKGDGWQMFLNDGRELVGGQVMLATGKHDLRGHARGRGIQPGLIAFKLHLQLSAEQTRQLHETVEVILFPGGYLGLQPTRYGRVNLCLLVAGKVLRRLGGGWVAILQHLTKSSRFLRERLAGAEECFPRPLALSHIPYGYLCRETDPGLWPLGDQAAVIPSFSGDGISIALHSAHCAMAFHSTGRDATEYIGQMRNDLHWQVTKATRLSRAMVMMPHLANLLRWFPGLPGYFARSTRIAEGHLFTDAMSG